MPSRPPYLSLSLLSASALGYEILLMRLFSIIQWHHFAYMVIALALLGYGVSGTLLTLIKANLQRRYVRHYVASALLFAFSAPIAFLLAQAIPFNVEELLWDPRQLIYLGMLFLLLVLPFVFAAAAICMTFMAFSGERASTIYACDLLGAGLGALAVMGLMYLLTPESILPLIALFGVAAATLAIPQLTQSDRRLAYAIAGVAALAITAGVPQIKLIISPYKGLAQTLQVQGARVIEQRSSPLGYLSVVESDSIPLRHAPGMSLIADTLPPRQLGLFTDADNLSAITAYPDSVDDLAYLDQTTSALAYHLLKPRSLLVIGSGTGSDLLQAHYHGVKRIEALELNPQVVELITRRFADFAGPVYRDPTTRVHIAEARDFLSHNERGYDLIQLALIDAAGASTSGLYALNEGYLYTHEAISLFLSRLTPEGILSITRWVKLPPRDTLKLFATAHQALTSQGRSDIARRMVLIRSWQTSTLLVKNGLFSDEELAAVSAFCDERFFDLAYTPNLNAATSNRYNRLTTDDFYQATQAIVSGQAEALFSDYKFDIRPATDDRPYFHHFFKWQSFREAYRLRGQGGMSLIEWGYVLLLATLGISLLISSLLILLPLGLVQRKAGTTAAPIQWRVILYFLGIGLSFLFIEIAFIQKFQLFLHHPIHAITVSLTGFLLFAGLGSHASGRLSARIGTVGTATTAVCGIALISLAYLWLLAPIFSYFSGIHMAVKMFLSLLLISPLALLMGMPFPLAIRALKQTAPALVPWAWGINGYASVISATLATLIAIHLGFNRVILIAVTIYLLALALFPAKKPRSRNGMPGGTYR
ncbi:MAG: SAM-dependent methyltransferase [Candidatus Thiodiazotropha sp.]